MEKALMIMGNSSGEIAEALIKFAENYAANKKAEQSTGKNDSEKMTTREAARFTGVSIKTFYNWIHEGRIPFYGSDRKRFFYKSEVIAAIKKLNNGNR